MNNIIEFNNKKIVLIKNQSKGCESCIFLEGGRYCTALDLDCTDGYFVDANNPIVTANKVQSVSELQEEIHNDNGLAGWWTDLDSGNNLAEEVHKSTRLGKALVAEKLCLIHSEVSEAMEGSRKNLMDDKLPHRKMLEVELADAVIRILDLCGALNLDLDGAIAEKRKYNKTRPDHQIENRTKAGGKAY